MLQLTLEDGRVVQRIFAGFVSDKRSYNAFYAELYDEVEQNLKEGNQPLLVEIWKDVTHTSHRGRHGNTAPERNGQGQHPSATAGEHSADAVHAQPEFIGR